MIQALFGLLGAGLSLWASTEKRKYLDEMIKLKERWYEEYNKDFDFRDNAKMDDIELKLRILVESFVTAVGKDATSEK